MEIEPEGAVRQDSQRCLDLRASRKPCGMLDLHEIPALRTKFFLFAVYSLILPRNLAYVAALIS